MIDLPKLIRQKVGPAQRMALLSRVAPGLARRRARALFLMPRKFNPPAPELEAIATGHRFEVDAGAQGKLACWSWHHEARGGGPVVYLVHGWAGRGGQLHSFIRPLLDAGFSVVTYDAPAHGESARDPARESTVLDFASALYAVVQKTGPAHGVIAHSMGAAAAGWAMQQGLSLRRAVFIGVPTGPEHYSRQFAPLVGITESVRASLQRELEQQYGIAWDRLRLAEMAKRQTSPLQIFHDLDDRDAPYAGGVEVARTWAGAELVTTKGLGHRKILRDPQVIAQAVAFLRR